MTLYINPGKAFKCSHKWCTGQGECVSPSSFRNETTFLLHEASLLILPQYEKQKPQTVNISGFIQWNRKDLVTEQFTRSWELGALWKYLKRPPVRKKADNKPHTRTNPQSFREKHTVAWDNQEYYT